MATTPVMLYYCSITGDDKERSTIPAPPEETRVETDLVFALGPAAGPLRARLRDSLGWALTGALGRPIEVRAYGNYRDLIDALPGVHFAWLPPAVYVRARSSLRLLGALQRSSDLSYHGVIFTREQSEIDDVRQVHGRSIAWVDADSAAGYLFPRLLLRESGVSADSMEQRWEGSHDAVVHAVAARSVDLGATYANYDANGELVRAAWMDTPTRRMKIVGISRPIPADVLCVTGDGDATANRFMTAFRGLGRHGSGQGLLGGLFGTYHIAHAEPENYDVVRDAIASVLEL